MSALTEREFASFLADKATVFDEIIMEQVTNPWVGELDPRTAELITQQMGHEKELRELRRQLKKRMSPGRRQLLEFSVREHQSCIRAIKVELALTS